MAGTNGYKTTLGYITRQKREWVSTGGGDHEILPWPTSVGGTVSPQVEGGSGYYRTTDVGTTQYISSFKEYAVSGNTSTLVRTDNVEYDANGNITKYGATTYVYDKLGRLTRENNLSLDKTFIWEYDIGGNILSKNEYAYTTGTVGTPTATYSYMYGNNSWKDQLTAFNGQTITYDNAGNPTNYKGTTLTWERGRLLVSYKPSGSNYTTTI